MTKEQLDAAQWVLMALLLLGGLWLSFRKGSPERASLDGNASYNYAQAAKIKSEENVKLLQEIQSMKERFDKIEKKKFRVCVDFTIGDPPEPGIVTIVPVIERRRINEPIAKDRRKTLQEK